MPVSAASTPLRALIALATLTAAVSLVGCSVDAKPETPAPKPATSDSPSSNTQKETVDENSDSNSSDSDTSASGLRADYLDAVTRTEDCASGSVSIGSSGEVVQIQGSCASVTVSGDGSVVLADDVDSLTVSGTGAVVITKKLGAVTASGIGNVVSWTNGSPTISDSGTGNVIQPE
ncbi:DUF3060 domain-containing protein [Leucobacter insecticola]|uniref:DUF3060 domain-containing protein n=1 Tax=Leucobacter insecticola TaxID=2714934 RepID=A0A6G8FLE3_9MICO|nr:DUF3060 domain-containing protein [Leucobacter insecticola]QIM17185.1 DUF3060 domain-containing protein [Leucobacter insecticola]